MVNGEQGLRTSHVTRTRSQLTEKENTETKIEETHKKDDIRALTREELEANIKMREKQREIKDVEKIYHDIHKKSIEEHEKK